MSSHFPLFFQPTFTQGLIIGQLSILILLGTILKYLFLESSQYPPTAYHQQVDNDAFVRQRNFQARQTLPEHDPDVYESTEWFNVLMKQVSIPSDSDCHRPSGFQVSEPLARSWTSIGLNFETILRE